VFYSRAKWCQSGQKTNDFCLHVWYPKTALLFISSIMDPIDSRTTTNIRFHSRAGLTPYLDRYWLFFSCPFCPFLLDKGNRYWLFFSCPFCPFLLDKGNRYWLFFSCPSVVVWPPMIWNPNFNRKGGSLNRFSCPHVRYPKRPLLLPLASLAGKAREKHPISVAFSSEIGTERPFALRAKNPRVFGHT
jgi:hypothetical protein